MPMTFTLTGVRRVAIGASASAQGRDGVPELTRTAFDALRNAEWSVSDEPPFVPVHDYAQLLPKGDAWKACYGYDADARTERAACGAVVYTFAVPADALTGTACNIAAVTGRVTGDRYLDAGVDCHVVLSASATPPSVADFLARTPDATLCATSSQTQPPNLRAGVTAELAVEPASAATAYVHVALLLHDYLGTRGAWIEGGALLEQGRVTVEFSRAVAADSADTMRLLQATGYHDGLLVCNEQINVFYQYVDNSVSSLSDAEIREDIGTVLDLVFGGTVAPAALNLGLTSPSGSDYGYPCSQSIFHTSGDSAGSFSMVWFARFYFARPLRAGWTVRVDGLVNNAAASGTARIALVQTDENPLIQPQDISISQAVRFDQAFRGDGGDLIGFADVTVSAASAAGRYNGDVPAVDIVCTRDVTKKYIAIVPIPISGFRNSLELWTWWPRGENGFPGGAPYLIATAP